MQLERKALYNSLQMNWMIDSSIPVDKWKVEDYRTLSMEDLFSRLEEFGIILSKNEFIALAEDVDTPEDLTDEFIHEISVNTEEEDQIYLAVFELWRRLVPQKRSLSIFCDELDRLIYQYDTDKIINFEPLEDAIANLEVILEENVDLGENPREVFKEIGKYCAHDIEAFLLDFISEQIDVDNDSYARELIEGFEKYIEKIKWFDFFKARLTGHSNPIKANARIRTIIEENDDHDLELNFEMLSFLVQTGDQDIFCKLVQRSLLLLETEDDFQDLLSISADYYARLDMEDKEKQILELLDIRKNNRPETPFSKKDPQIPAMLSILDCK